MAYTLITANRNYSSWSLRPWVLMRALELPFEEHIFCFATAAENYANFKPLSPNGMVPCLHHGEQEVWDSLAIMEYLAEYHKGVWPADLPARTWARCAAAEMHGGFNALRDICPMNIGVRARLYDNVDSHIGEDTHMNPRKLSLLNANIRRINELWCDGLTRFGGPWLAGKTFTAADAFFAPVVYRFRTYGFNAQGPAKAWMQAMLEHPAMLDWEQQALAETAREQAHEEEIMEIALITDDFRALDDKTADMQA